MLNSTNQVISPCYEHWRNDMLDGDEELLRHLRLMERGDHGHFAQALYKAYEKADRDNSETLYNAFHTLFNPR